jgi:hypothetical protein
VDDGLHADGEGEDEPHGSVVQGDDILYLTALVRCAC